MIVVFKSDATEEEKAALSRQLCVLGCSVHMLSGALSVQCDAPMTECGELVRFPGVLSVLCDADAPLLSERAAHAEDTVVDFGTCRLGGGEFAVIAGPCAVESEEQIISAARAVRAAGAQLLRGGAYKPRTSPYSFQGLGAEGLRLLKLARAETGLPIVSEIPGVSELEEFADVDLIQVGARNMQNYDLLRALGTMRTPVLLKRGQSATLRELLLSAEYILRGGNAQVILCERGIRSFDTFSRNTLDLAAVPMLKELSHLPVIVDPSHATGLRRLVAPMALSAAVCGADGLMLEVHPDPASAKSDAAQALSPAEFAALTEKLARLRAAL